MNNVNNYYQKDLAYIHDIGFGNFASKSTAAIIKILQDSNIKSGLIVDLGCGSGISAKKLIEANYRVLGIDISQSMIEIARNRVPEAEFKVQTLFNTEIPQCNVVISIGECLNYLFDVENNSQNLTRLCDRIYRSLLPGGMFLFDLLKPFTTEKTQGFTEGRDWIVMFEKQEDRAANTLTRRIITFRRVEKHYRRNEEIHQVQLYEPSEIIAKLRQVGFKVKTQSSYGDDFELSPAHTVFIARK